MKKKITLSVLSFLFSVQTFSQSPNWLWANTLGGATNDYGWTSAIDVNGNVYISGSFEGTVDFDPGTGVFNLTAAGTTNDVYILKLDALGNFIWAKQIGGSGYENTKFIYLDPSGSGDIFITGIFQGTTDFDPGPGTFNLTGNGMFISRLDNSCNLIWVRTMNGTATCGFSIAVDPVSNGTIYTTGVFQGTVDFDPGVGVFNMSAAGQYDIYVSKFDMMGNFIWAKRMGGLGCDWGFSIAFDPSGSGCVYTTGAFEYTVDFDPGIGTCNLTGGSIYISKLDSAGNFVWAKIMEGGGIEGANSIIVDPSGNGDIYTTGNYSGTTDFDPGAGTFNLTPLGATDIFISKLDASGNFIWAKSMGGSANNDCAFSMVIDPSGSGDIYTTGFFMGTADFDPGAGVFNLTAVGNNTDIFISKLSASGDFIWAKAVGGSSYDRGQSIALDAFGNLYVVGYFLSPSISFGINTFANQDSTGYKADIFIAKLDNEVITGNDEIENFVNGILLFPNPATSEIILNFDKETYCDMQLCNTLGEILFQTSAIAGSMKIDVRDFPKGIYFVAVRDEKNNLVVRKIVKM